MTTAAIREPKKVPPQRHRLPTSSRALRASARKFLRLTGVDVVWLAVRESRGHGAIVHCAEGARSRDGLGRLIDPGSGLGGAVLRTGSVWHDVLSGEDDFRLSDAELALLAGEGVRHLIVVPLRAPGFGGELRAEGIAYAGARIHVVWNDRVVRAARRIGERVARRVRDAQRLSEVAERWDHAWAELGAGNEAADRKLERVALQIAADVRTVLRSGIGIVFRLDAASGALHSLALDGAVVPGEVVPAVQRGQVLPRECGCAGRAVALGTPFIAPDYASGCVVVPPTMAEAVATLPVFTTMSFPLRVGRDVIGAVTVGRLKTRPLVDYSPDDVRLAVQLGRMAAPLLVRAQRLAERARRQQGASELSRLARSLTKSLSVSAVSQQLVRSVLALLHGHAAAIWNSHGEIMLTEGRRPGILRDPKDSGLEEILGIVVRSRQAFWTPDVGNDSRLTVPALSRANERSETRALLIAPLRIRDTVIAVLGVTRETGRAFTDADVELVQALADQAALGVANARAYEELQVSNIQLLRHEKLVAMGRLTSGLAHELRNPLQNVVGLTSELVERSGGSLREHGEFADFPEYLRRAHGEAKRAAEIVDRLLDHVRERTPALESIDVRSIVAEAVGIISAATRNTGIQVAVASEDVPIVVRADAMMLRQVVLNLLHNAVDAVGGAGTIAVDIRVERDVVGPGRAVVRVSDSGRGVAEDDLPRIFEPFFTTKDCGHGVGLGLAICQSFIEQHGGTIRAFSAGVGKGTTVEFDLPVER
jgi:signal transduction histidine kinase